jgi:HEPN domain-containing protein
MRNIDIANHLLKEAERRLRTARIALGEEAYAYAVRQSQECVELSLKGILRLVMIEYPKKHDVSDVLRREAQRFPAWFRGVMQEISEVSASLSEKRSLAMYGDELRGLSPEMIFDKKDAEKALRDAEFVFNNCIKMMNEWVRSQER